MKPPFRGVILLLAALMVPSLAHAHVGVGETTGFFHGLGHPLNGLDHICAMIAVGLWAVQMGGRSTWAVPLAFVGVMALGGLLSMMGVSLPFVEMGIVFSVLALGVLVAGSVRLPLAASMLTVGLFAAFHGYAHGAQMPEGAPGLAYAAGFIAATALLHAFGIGLGVAIQRLARPQAVCFAGVAIALCGGSLLLS